MVTVAFYGVERLQNNVNPWCLFFMAAVNSCNITSLFETTFYIETGKHNFHKCSALQLQHISDYINSFISNHKLCRASTIQVPVSTAARTTVKAAIIKHLLVNQVQEKVNRGLISSSTLCVWSLYVLSVF